jgi:hypothetical protein
MGGAIALAPRTTTSFERWAREAPIVAKARPAAVVAEACV